MPDSGDVASPAGELVDVVNGDVEVDRRFWIGSRRREATAARDRAIAAAAAAVVEDDMALPVDELRVELTAGHNEDRGHRHVHTDGQGER